MDDGSHEDVAGGDGGKDEGEGGNGRERLWRWRRRRGGGGDRDGQPALARIDDCHKGQSCAAFRGETPVIGRHLCLPCATRVLNAHSAYPDPRPFYP